MARLVTGLIGAILVLAAILWLPRPWFFAMMVLSMGAAALEYSRIARHWSPSLPVWFVPLVTPLLAYPLCMPMPEFAAEWGWREGVFAGLVLLSLVTAVVALVRSSDMGESLGMAGALSFGLPYFALPIASVVLLRELGTPVLILLLSIIWAGDAAAYYVGKSIGKHKLAPVVSPNKSWEGSAANLITGLIVTVAWSFWQLDALEPRLLLIAVLTSIASQLGDLVESMFKRGAGVKDSGDLLPGHGGFYDRLDAMILGAPVMLLGIWLLAPALP